MIGIVGRASARLVPLLIALTVGACGDADQPPEADPESGRLVVQKSLADGPVFTEGSVTHLRIVGRGGGQIVDELRPVETLDEPIFDRVAPVGTYRVTAVERPCQGNCQSLDPPIPETRCALSAEVRGNQTTRVDLVLRTTRAGAPRSGCSGTTKDG